MKLPLFLTHFLIFVHASEFYQRPGGLLIERRRFNGSFSCDETREFDCGVGSKPCIPLKSVCDNRFDCINRLDERYCDSWCPNGFSKCQNTTDCVNNAHFCDRHIDCPDKSDEENCSNTYELLKVSARNLTAAVCKYSEFNCGMGEKRCIPRKAVCDGVTDCMNGVDERNCKNQCLKGLFPCRNTKNCIYKSFFCDGKIDCEDESDEEDCPQPEPKTSHTRLHITPWFACDHEREFDCEVGKKRCIDKGMVCNGVEECSNGVDERNCDYICPPRHSPCGDRTCIFNKLICDHKQDCSDNSDEMNCPEIYVDRVEPITEPPLICNQEEEFDCEYGTRRCILEKFWCDGKYDCWNGLDEMNCNHLCQMGSSPCRDQKLCLQNHRFCDGYQDCEDNSDENNCPARGRPPKASKPNGLSLVLGFVVMFSLF